MVLRQTIEGLVADFVHDLFALVMVAPLNELAELERCSSAGPASPLRSRTRVSPRPARLASTCRAPVGAGATTACSCRPSPLEAQAPPSRAASRFDAADLRPPALPFHRDNRIVVPQDKRGIVLQDIQLTVRLYNLLFGLPYVVLGDLDGRSFGELGQHPGMGHACQTPSKALASIGVVVPAPPVETPAVPTIHVPEFATSTARRATLSGSRAWGVFGARRAAREAGEGPPPSPPCRVRHDQELQSLLAAMAAAGPPAPAGLLDLLDVGLDGLPEDRRRLLLARFGGAGEEPLTLAELGRQHDRTRSWIAIMQARALDRLRTQADPYSGGCFATWRTASRPDGRSSRRSWPAWALVPALSLSSTLGHAPLLRAPARDARSRSDPRGTREGARPWRP